MPAPYLPPLRILPYLTDDDRATPRAGLYCVTVRLPTDVIERLSAVARHYGVSAHALRQAILCDWVGRHCPYRASDFRQNGTWYDRRYRRPHDEEDR